MSVCRHPQEVPYRQALSVPQRNGSRGSRPPEKPVPQGERRPALGGAVGPSQEIYEAIELYREKQGVTIYASLGTVAASGGYWIALVADQIYANAGTLTGSIGALMEMVNLEELFNWLRVKPFILKAGKYKDIGNANRPMKPEERRLLNQMLAEIHSQFKQKVAERRKIEPVELEKIAQGQVFNGQQAQALKLVDHIGGFVLTVNDLKMHLGLPEDEELYYPTPSKSIREFIEKLGSTAAKEGVRLLLQGQHVPRLSY